MSVISEVKKTIWKFVGDKFYDLVYTLYDYNGNGQLVPINLTGVDRVRFIIKRREDTAVLLDRDGEVKDAKMGVVNYTVQPEDFPLSKFESTESPIPQPWSFTVYVEIYKDTLDESYVLGRILFSKK